MSLPIPVDAYSGYKANERPRQFALDEEIYEIAAVLDQWYEPSATYFKVQSTEGKTYLLRLNPANTVTLPMPKFRSTGFLRRLPDDEALLNSC